MAKHILTNTKQSTTRKHHTPNIQYINNTNQKNHRSADTTTNYNDKRNDKITNCRYSIKKQKSIHISNSHLLLKNNTNKTTKTTPTKNIVNQYCTSTHSTTNNNNV